MLELNEHGASTINSANVNPIIRQHTNSASQAAKNFLRVRGQSRNSGSRQSAASSIPSQEVIELSQKKKIVLTSGKKNGNRSHAGRSDTDNSMVSENQDSLIDEFEQ